MTVTGRVHVSVEESIVQYAAADDSTSRFCEDMATRIEAKIKQQRDLLEHTGWEQPAPIHLSESLSDPRTLELSVLILFYLCFFFLSFLIKGL